MDNSGQNESGSAAGGPIKSPITQHRVNLAFIAIGLLLWAYWLHLAFGD